VEIIRRQIRKILGSKSWLYQAGAIILNFISVFWKENLSVYRLLMKQAALPKGHRDLELKLKLLRYPIRVRAGTLDSETIINNIIREEYGHFSPSNEIGWIIDAGGYIGDTSVYFLSRYSNSKVVTLEPLDENFKAAKHNLESYGERSHLIQKGLWGSDTTLSFQGDSTGGYLSEVGSCQIECVSIPTLIKKYSIKNISILKMDIEGAEGNVFATDPELWLPITEMIIIEIHSVKLIMQIAEVLKENNFEMIQYRSIWYCINKYIKQDCEVS
jgi:FkbM family methyltransferase